MKRASSLVLGSLVALLVAMPADLSAQMVLDVGGGITSATFYGDDTDVDGKGSRIGFHLGAGLVIPMNERFSIVPGAHYVQKGVKVEQGGGEFGINLDYLLIPVLGSIALNPGSSTGFNVFFGPQVSFEIGCTQDFSGGGQSGSQDCESADDDGRNTIDFGAVVGAGVAFPIGETLNLSLSAGADFGLTSIFEDESVKNRVFFGRASVLIPIGG